MPKVYIGPLLSWPYLPILYPNLGFQKKTKYLFINNAFSFYQFPVLEIVKEPQAADYFLLPHDYFWAMKEGEYLKQFIFLAERHRKKIIIFTHTDFDDDIPVANSIIFRTSQYRYKKKPNEIIMPAYVEDLAGERPVLFRHKSNKPVIGFCGWAGFKNFGQKIRFYLKFFCLELIRFPWGYIRVVRRKGLWFRRKVLEILKNSSLVSTNFIIRKSFSSHSATIEAPPEQARREYIDNILNSDFVLAVKGDGNFSLRFYEALSLGRIPLLVDTDCVLPLEDKINYNDFAVFIPWRDIDKIDVILREFYDKLSPDKFLEMQRKAREAFKNYLRIDAFFKIVPQLIKLHGQAS